MAKIIKKYSDDELIDYFIEVVRDELPELKGTKLYFSTNWDDNKVYKII